jgi:peptide/nickel transport system substrate-binding protein
VLSGLGSQLIGYNTSALAANGCTEPPTEANLTGRLAKTVSVSQDGKTITLTLRPLKSPAGNTLSAADVAWSLQRDIHLDSFVHDNLESAGYNLKNLTTIVNPTTVQLHLTMPTSYALESLTNNIVNIYDSKTVKQHATPKDPWGNKWLSTHIADYSGWKLESFSPNQSLVVDANPNWGGPRGNVTRISFSNVPDPATRQELVASGQANITTGLNVSQYTALKAQSGVRVINCHSYTRDELDLNTKYGPLANQQVRNAISLAINHQAIAAGAYGGFAVVPTSEMPSANRITTTHPYVFDVAKAKQMLAAAGYPNGFALQLTYSPEEGGASMEQDAILLQSQLAKLGIRVTARNVASSSDFSNLFYGKNFQALLRSNGAPFTDPAFNEHVELTSKGPDDMTSYSNSKYDKLVDELTNTPLTQTAKRNAILQQMVAIVALANPVITLAEPPNLYAVTNTIAPITPLPDGALLWTQLHVIGG